MEELFTGAGYYEGGGISDWIPGNWLSWLTVWVVLLTLVVVLVFAGVIPVKVKSGFSQREGLYPGIMSIRDDTGFPSNDALGDAVRKRENLVEAGRYPNLYTPSQADLATTLALQNNVANAAAAGAAGATPTVAPPAAAASAFRNKFTERMTPEEELQMRQAALGAVAASS